MFREIFERHGYTIVRGSNASTAASIGPRKPLDDQTLWAPDPKLVLEALKHFRNDADNLPSHNHFVQALAAIKASLGPAREHHYPVVEEWGLEFPGNTPEYVRKTWDSLNDAVLGWSWLASEARAHGFSDAEEIFPDDVPAEWVGGIAPWERGSAGTAPPAKKPEFSWADKLDGQPEPVDFVEGLLCDGQSSVIYGDANVGKSFFALDLAYHVALGWKWWNRDVEQGAVVYVAGEGAGGMRRRVRAFREAQGVEATAGAPLAIVHEAINFRDEREIANLIAVARKVAEQSGVAVRWIIVDTLSRALAGGNENAPDDMGLLVRGVDRVRTGTGCHVSLIHHSGKDDARGARGHSLLRAAIDTEIKIDRQDGQHGSAVATVTKQRDLEYGLPMAFRLRTVNLGTNARGKSVTSCVVEAVTARGPVLKEAEQEAVNILCQLIAGSDGTTVRMADWRAGVLSAENLFSGQKPDSRERQWRRIRKSLEERGVIDIYGENVGLKSR
jgi:hypothetical protein